MRENSLCASAHVAALASRATSLKDSYHFPACNNGRRDFPAVGNGVADVWLAADLVHPVPLLSPQADLRGGTVEHGSHIHQSVQTVHAYAAVGYAVVDNGSSACFVAPGDHSHLFTEGVIVECR
jgi:hypothetical protein